MKLTRIKEGAIEIRAPLSERPEKSMPVFYNRRKVTDRSLSVILLQSHRLRSKRDLLVCDLLAATGVRGLRFASEVSGLKKVVLNDMNRQAFELMKENVKMNESRLRCKVDVKNERGARLLLGTRERFDVIDVDPFGSPNPFLDAAVRSLRLGGILAVTSTDTACLCGVYPKTCFRKYGALVHKTEYFREVAVRILAKKVIEVGAQYYLALRPVFAYSFADSFRVYSLLEKGAEATDKLLGQIGFILHCDQCLFREAIDFGKLTRERCPKCGSNLSTIGPVFLGRLYDKKLCKSMANHAHGPIRSIVDVMLGESEIEEPWYYTTSALCSRLKTPMPKIDRLIADLKRKGHKASRTHFDAQGIKTNASAEELEEIIRAT